MITDVKKVERKKYNDFNEILLENIQPYLGCTDISIIALGTALAAQAAHGIVPKWIKSSSEEKSFREIKPENVVSISLQMNEALYKSSHATSIPNAQGSNGFLKSAALGVFLNPEEKLNLFTEMEDKHIEQMLEVVENAEINVETIDVPSCNMYLRIKISIRDHKGEIITGESWLMNSYTGVVSLSRNGETLFYVLADAPQIAIDDIDFDIPQIIDSLENLSDDVYEKLEETIQLNTLAYQHGLKYEPGLGIGAKYHRMIQKGLLGDDASNQAAAITAAAEDVRMGGEDIPVMGIASSGSHGIAASLPIIAVAEKISRNRKRLLKSLALSFWITQKISGMIGFLSVPCGCVIKSGIGAAAGIAYYLGGTPLQIEQSINNFIISMAGVICDGGKTTCSIKLANAASCASHSAFLALEGVKLSKDVGGIVRDNLQKNIENMVQITNGMQDLDKVIVGILKDYQNEEEKTLSSETSKNRGETND